MSLNDCLRCGEFHLLSVSNYIMPNAIPAVSPALFKSCVFIPNATERARMPESWKETSIPLICGFPTKSSQFLHRTVKFWSQIGSSKREFLILQKVLVTIRSHASVNFTVVGTHVFASHLQILHEYANHHGAVGMCSYQATKDILGNTICTTNITLKHKKYLFVVLIWSFSFLSLLHYGLKVFHWKYDLCRFSNSHLDRMWSQIADLLQTIVGQNIFLDQKGRIQEEEEDFTSRSMVINYDCSSYFRFEVVDNVIDKVIAHVSQCEISVYLIIQPKLASSSSNNGQRIHRDFRC